MSVLIAQAIRLALSFCFSSGAWASGDSSEVQFQLKSGGSYIFEGHTFVGVRVSLSNHSNKSVLVSINDGAIECFNEGEWSVLKLQDRKELLVPRWYWREAVFVLPQGRGENYRVTTVAPWKDDTIGLIGPIEELSDCRYSMTVDVASLTEKTMEIVPGSEYSIGPSYLLLDFRK